MGFLMELLEYITLNIDEIISRVFEHLQLTVLSVTISILIGVPLGILISYIKGLKKPILGLSNVMQAIPSLALLGFLIPFLGIGEAPAIFMVVIYSLLPIIKNTTTGLDSISKEMVEVAKGIGMTRFQVLTKVKLPLALPVIMAGVRISAVTSVGLVTMAAFIGAGGLGYLVYSGIRTVNNLQILAGAIPACMMALSIDFLVSLVEKAVTPISFTDKAQSANHSSIKKFNIRKKIVLCSALLLLLSAFAANIFGKTSEEKVIVIGAKDYTEQNILGHIYSELIKANTDISVDLKTELGSQVVFTAITNEEVDLYVDYTGTVYGSILGYSKANDSQTVYDICVADLKEKYNLLMLDPLGFNNTYTLSVRSDTAEKYGLKTYSDLAEVSNRLTLGATFEILNRNDGIPNLLIAYDMTFKEMIGIDGTPRYTAIANDEIQVTDAFSTDGMLLQYDLVVLEDDKGFFPPYQAAPVVRPEILVTYPELETVLEKLTGILDDDTMRELNYQVDVLKKNPKDVAIEFLESKGMN